MTSTEFTVGATDRANKVLAFDSSGEIAVTQELGTFKGDSATTTTAAFSIRDIVKGTTAAQLNNIYICIQASPIGTALTNTSYWVLIVDAVSAATSATAAASSASAASTSATAATNNGAAQVTLATAQVALATTQAGNAASSATTSGNSATASGNSATASANSATAAAASADAFDDIYLGTKSSDPTADNDGDALAAGMLSISSTGVVTLTGTQTLTNKTLTSPKINENVAVTSTATELNLLDGKAATNLALVGKLAGTNFTDSLLVGTTATGTLSSASANVGVGINSLRIITSGDNNTAIGVQTGYDITSGTANTLVGHNAGVNVSDGHYNTLLGRSSGSLINSGQKNITIGNQSGDNITTGDGNVIIGSINADSATGDKQLILADGVDGSVAWIKGDANGQVKLISGYIAEVALTDASTITWNAATQPVAKVTLTANRIMGLPSNPVSGQFISILLIQDAGGTNTITWNAAYEFAADTAPTLTSTGNLGDLFTFRYNGAKWLEVGRNLALTLS
jgi:hypothetical protein